MHTYTYTHTHAYIFTDTQHAHIHAHASLLTHNTHTVLALADRRLCAAEDEGDG